MITKSLAGYRRKRISSSPHCAKELPRCGVLFSLSSPPQSERVVSSTPPEPRSSSYTGEISLRGAETLAAARSVVRSLVRARATADIKIKPRSRYRGRSRCYSRRGCARVIIAERRERAGIKAVRAILACYERARGFLTKGERERVRLPAIDVLVVYLCARALRAEARVYVWK